MEFYDVVNSRHTVRDFIEAPINDEIIDRIISAGMRAPSNDHMRDWQFIVIKDKDTVLRLIDRIPVSMSTADIDRIIHDWNLKDPYQKTTYSEALPKQYSMLAEASCLIIPLFKRKTDLLHPDNLSHLNGLASIWCCIENMLLAITAEGYASALRIPLGTEGDWAREVLGYPEDYIMPCYLAVGRADDTAHSSAEREYAVKDKIHINKW